MLRGIGLPSIAAGGCGWDSLAPSFARRGSPRPVATDPERRLACSLMLPSLAQGYLIVLLAAMAVGQLLTRERFEFAMGAYPIARPRLAAWPLIAGEATAVLLLVLPPTRLVGALVALAVAVAWTVLAVRATLERRHVPNCACFGAYMPQRLGWWVLVQDALFIALAVWATFVELT